MYVTISPTRRYRIVCKACDSLVVKSCWREAEGWCIWGPETPRRGRRTSPVINSQPFDIDSFFLSSLLPRGEIFHSFDIDCRKQLRAEISPRLQDVPLLLPLRAEHSRQAPTGHVWHRGCRAGTGRDPFDSRRSTVLWRGNQCYETLLEVQRVSPQVRDLSTRANYVAREVSSLLVELRAENSLYINSINMLLIGVVGQTEMAIFLADPGGTQWKDKRFERNLKKRLGTSYTSYLEIITQLLRIADQFKERLKLNSYGKVTSPSQTVFSISLSANLSSRLNLTIRTVSKNITSGCGSV
jgi:hypothetical protein